MSDDAVPRETARPGPFRDAPAGASRRASIAAGLFSLPIRFYRRALSPLLPPACRFEPSCSRYALDALELHGAARGLWLAARRLGRCQPWGGHGHDPVPPLRSTLPPALPRRPDRS